MTMGIEPANAIGQLKDQLDWADVIAIGPGLGRTPATQSFVRELYATIDQTHGNGCRRAKLSC